MSSTLEQPERRIGLCGNATRAPTQRPEWAGGRAQPAPRRNPFWRQCVKFRGLGGSPPNKKGPAAPSLSSPAILLELDWWHIAESGVQARFVVDVFNERADRGERIWQIAVL